ncbi:hypothetical protein OF83DRAFT_1177780, partial [Amylostereum chailletii]
MDSDVEMLEGKPRVVVASSSPRADASRLPSPIVVDGADSPVTVVDSDKPEPASAPRSASSHINAIKPDPPASSAPHINAIKPDPPASSAPSPAPTPAPTTKPKSTKHRQRSPSPSPPPAPPPPLQTIRLEISLGGPDNYEVDIALMAKETGQRPPTPPPAVKQYESESEGEDAKDKDAPDDGGKGKKKKKKNLGAEYYDLNDPFIDDSELAVDERTYFAQTKQQGFYVSSGEVALLKDKTPKKPKSKRPALPPPEPIAGPSNFPHAHPQHTLLGRKDKDKEKEKEKENGTREAPIALISDAEDVSSANGKRKSLGPSDGGRKKRKVAEIQPFHPELEEAFDDLKSAIAKESWETKGKFPQQLKPRLCQVALKAIRLNEYDHNFFNIMPRLFPYNRFTMSKLIKRLIFPEHMALLVTRQDEILLELKGLADEGFPKAEEEWERSVAAWQKRQEKAKADGALPEEVPSTPPDAVSVPMDVDKADDGEGKDGKEDKAGHPPGKRYRLTERMKGLIWNLVCLSN